jgi:hypothetical protein
MELGTSEGGGPSANPTYPRCGTSRNTQNTGDAVASRSNCTDHGGAAVSTRHLETCCKSGPVVRHHSISLFVTMLEIWCGDRLWQ